MNPEGVSDSLLTDIDSMRALDRGGMLGILQNYPHSIRDANELGREFDTGTTASVRNIVLAGLGGSAIGGEVAQSVVASRCKVPLLINREHRLPGFVKQDTLVIACSYSGDTEETLAAYCAARDRKAKLIAITSGGRLGEQSQQDAVPLLRIPGGIPPRAAIAYSVFPILWILHRAGVWDWKEQTADETAAVVSAACGDYEPQTAPARNVAKQVALRLRGRLPVIYAASDPLGAVATRWKSQLCENAKILAWHNVLPELNHNEIVGWEHPELLERAQVICLRDPDEHPQVAAGFEFLVRRLRSITVAAEQCWGRGQSLLARIFSLILLGDYVSVYLAFLNGEDPTPVKVITQLKQELKKAP